MDNRENLISHLKARIGSILEPSLANVILDEIVKELSNYEISERCTDLAVPDNANERILRRYTACLRLDGKSEKTIYQYQRTITRLGEAIPKLFTEMGAYDIRYYLAMEKEHGLSNRTLENTRANISAFFQWMSVEDMIPKNPCLTIKPIKCPKEEKKPFSDTEIDTLRSACKDSRERAIVEMLLSTGLRISELIALDMADVDLETKSVHVRRGKGGKERTTYATSVAIKHFRNYLVNRKEICPAVFLNDRGGRITVSGIRYILKDLGKRAGVENVHPHRFRRTFASGLAARGMGVQDIKKLLGHSDINTTMVYVHTDDSVVKMSYQRYAV